MAVGLVFGILMMIIEMILFIARASIRATQEEATRAAKETVKHTKTGLLVKQNLKDKVV